MEWNWRFWSHCPGWYSDSEPELENTGVSNYPGPILTYKQSVMSMIWLSWVTVVSVWSPCTMTTGASNCCHFPHSMDTCSWSHTSITELSVTLFPGPTRKITKWSLSHLRNLLYVLSHHIMYKLHDHMVATKLLLMMVLQSGWTDLAMEQLETKPGTWE